MISKLVLSEIIKDQLTSVLKKQWIEREKEIPLQTKKIVIVSGVRRCGKSTLYPAEIIENRQSALP